MQIEVTEKRKRSDLSSKDKSNFPIPEQLYCLSYMNTYNTPLYPFTCGVERIPSFGLREQNITEHASNIVEQKR